MNLIFLDIDGVLNTHDFNHAALCGPIHKDKVELLNGVLRATGAEIVLSSAWRYLTFRGEMNQIGLEWLLRSHGLIAGRLFGVTREDTLIREPWTGNTPWVHTNERGQQVTDWLRDNAYGERYVVIDDMDLGISAARHPFIHVNGTLGLTAENCALACDLLLQESTSLPGSPP